MKYHLKIDGTEFLAKSFNPFEFTFLNITLVKNLQKNSFFWPHWNGSISGRANSIISFIAIEENILQDILPRGLVLADQKVTTSGYHPVYLAFNLTQKNVTTIFPGFTLNYSEFACGIPYVQMQQGVDATTFAYSPVLYLNSILATLGGSILFSLPKKYANVTTSSSTTGNTLFTTARFFNPGKIHFKASWKHDGPAVAGFDSENFLSVKPMLTQPLIVHSPLQGFRTTDYVIEELVLSTIQPIEGECNTKNFLKGLDNRHLRLDSINHSPLGSFQMEYNWRLTRLQPV